MAVQVSGLAFRHATWQSLKSVGALTSSSSIPSSDAIILMISGSSGSSDIIIIATVIAKRRPLQLNSAMPSLGRVTDGTPPCAACDVRRCGLRCYNIDAKSDIMRGRYQCAIPRAEREWQHSSGSGRRDSHRWNSESCWRKQQHVAVQAGALSGIRC
jgi:hypothetical protein